MKTNKEIIIEELDKYNIVEVGDEKLVQSNYITQNLLSKLQVLDREEYGKQLENALRKARMDGWEKGKKQVETPYDFTLVDDTYLENIWKELMNYIPIREVKK